MWEWLKNDNNLKALGTGINAVGNIYSGIQQSKVANSMLDLQNKQYDFNKSMILADDERRKKTQANYDKALSMPL